MRIRGDRLPYFPNVLESSKIWRGDRILARTFPELTLTMNQILDV